MYCRVLACDYDGTTAVNGKLVPEVAAALRAARAQGLVTLLVTGRVLPDLHAAQVDWTAFDAVVAENGAIVWLPGRDRTFHLGSPPPAHFLGELRARGVPFHAGAVVLGTADRHAGELLDVVRRLGIDGQLAFNTEALMRLPTNGSLTRAVPASPTTSRRCSPATPWRRRRPAGRSCSGTTTAARSRFRARARA